MVLVLVSVEREHCGEVKGVFGTVRTEAYRRYIPAVLPVLDTSVSSASIPVQETSLSLTRH